MVAEAVVRHALLQGGGQVIPGRTDAIAKLGVGVVVAEHGAKVGGVRWGISHFVKLTIKQIMKVATTIKKYTKWPNQ